MVEAGMVVDPYPFSEEVGMGNLSCANSSTFLKNLFVLE